MFTRYMYIALYFVKTTWADKVLSMEFDRLKREMLRWVLKKQILTLSSLASKLMEVGFVLCACGNIHYKKRG